MQLGLLHLYAALIRHLNDVHWCIPDAALSSQASCGSSMRAIARRLRKVDSALL